MLTALIPLIASTVVSTSASVAVDSAVKMIVPLGLKTIPAFSIKIGTSIAGTVVGWKLGNIVKKEVKEILEIVNDQEDVPAQEDN